MVRWLPSQNPLMLLHCSADPGEFLQPVFLSPPGSDFCWHYPLTSPHPHAHGHLPVSQTTTGLLFPSLSLKPLPPPQTFSQASPLLSIYRSAFSRELPSSTLAELPFIRLPQDSPVAPVIVHRGAIEQPPPNQPLSPSTRTGLSLFCSPPNVPPQHWGQCLKRTNLGLYRLYHSLRFLWA